ncbi:low molecular weight protein-tyrosine-phosphatase [Nocardioides acrostichi]|uniref:protein-tyrosine-phosphatase n=1 Tax=Nocardioides acrostichi TaxID=2784339 RepID=A0A930V0V1_9ACTN|nr:low molecular weight protein-tyrosine-phosphatase [Nocardioides acrostichi]MBF4161179.1 low molecular weight phosphotyrosine protein phosphatase [Nocardioides acrostichi]
MTHDRSVPSPRTPGHYRLGLVCLGNICRSPMAEVVLRARVDDAGLAGCVDVDSCGTGGWHVGRPMDERAASVLLAGHYDPSDHRAQQYDDTWPAAHDLLLAMDADNLAELGGRSERVHLFRDHDPIGTGDDVPDPYYGGERGFEEVLAMVERTCATLVAALQREPDLGARP